MISLVLRVMTPGGWHVDYLVPILPDAGKLLRIRLLDGRTANLDRPGRRPRRVGNASGVSPPPLVIRAVLMTLD